MVLFRFQGRGRAIGANAHLVPALIWPRKLGIRAAASMLSIVAANVARWVAIKPRNSSKMGSIRREGDPHLESFNFLVALSLRRFQALITSMAVGRRARCLAAAKVRSFCGVCCGWLERAASRWLHSAVAQ